MGTRSTTRIRVKSDKKEAPVTLLTFYRQMDGYPSGHGLELGKEIASYQMVNGLGMGQSDKVANGSGCLAAQLLCHFKGDSDGAGGIYLIGDNEKSFDNDYHYDIMITEKWSSSYGTPKYTFHVTVVSYGEHDKPIFSGTLNQFVKFCKKN